MENLKDLIDRLRIGLIQYTEEGIKPLNDEGRRILGVLKKEDVENIQKGDIKVIDVIIDGKRVRYRIEPLMDRDNLILCFYPETDMCINYSQYKFSRIVEMIEVIAGISHRINNPLQAVMGFSELLKERTNDKELLEYTEHIISSVTRIKGVVEQFCAYTNMLKNYDEKKEIQISRILEDSLLLLKSHPYYSKVDVAYVIERDFTINASPDMIREALFRLLENAIEFAYSSGTDGWVRITVDRGEEEGRVLVENSGSPIDTSKVVQIFEHFYSTSGDKLGLGLGIAKRLITWNNGSIVYKEDSKHPAFLIEFPVSEREKVSGILIVDDEVENVKLLEKALSSMGYKVDCAYTGKEALEKIESERYNVIILDMILPDMSGYRVFLDMDDKQKKRVIVLTGDSMHPELRELKKWGVRVLLKPVTIETLKSEIEGIVNERG